ncbi:hypothetical protein C9F11_23290 [Streptomyces sp. YIM 121038]|uniref:hypothetical protein n=1 Tax=Streptomyces sp. YIM 121038 TaxID=2136401 RepID=UPI0011105394|nr:hypothetical protein [Streptomyces sp. YIM 121038]QCX78278.1 hypothetical protein C9F11_23290 [Streptomyces sp. YIM 121038]
MPRGRHRHSPPLHRLLPPSAVAGFSLAAAGGAWLFAEPVVLRGLAAAAAASAVLGSVVMRRWDRAAGKRVAELGRARASEEWRYEERIAECESDLDEARELRSKLENKLRSKRAELAALRNEHAALLRRYATAETERASALEGRRLLAIEATTSTRALPAGSAEDAEEDTPEASLYERANAALDRLTGRHGEAEAEIEVEVEVEAVEDLDASDAPEAEADDKELSAPEAAEAADEPEAADEAVDGHERAAGAHLLVPAAAAVVPPAQARRTAGEGGFDFFGTKGAAPAALDAVQNEDLADVVGEEALAVHKAEAEAEFKPSDATTDAERGVGQVIDLTAHDETEQIDLKGLRTALRA